MMGKTSEVSEIILLSDLIPRSLGASESHIGVTVFDSEPITGQLWELFDFKVIPSSFSKWGEGQRFDHPNPGYR